MGRNRGAAGMAYEVVYKNESEVTVTYTYCCPYCNGVSTAQKEYFEGLNIIERGLFYEPLECMHCAKITDVRFLPHNRV